MPSEAEAEFLHRVHGEHREVPEAGTRKPDPSEPWRYVCPDCGGQVQGKGRQYLCGSCGARHDKDDLRDLMDGGPSDG